MKRMLLFAILLVIIFCGKTYSQGFPEEDGGEDEFYINKLDEPYSLLPPSPFNNSPFESKYQVLDAGGNGNGNGNGGGNGNGNGQGNGNGGGGGNNIPINQHLWIIMIGAVSIASLTIKGKRFSQKK